MTSKAIGGPLAEQDLVELPVSEKATWKDWRTRHPKTRVLSIDGKEHVESNPYDSYFANDKTFRDLAITDRRLPAKAPIFAFWIGEKPMAVPHAAFAGGRTFSAKIFGGRQLLLFRRPGAAVFESTRAFLIPRDMAKKGFEAQSLLPADGEAVPAEFEPVTGFDTFWYNWVSVHGKTKLLK